MVTINILSKPIVAENGEHSIGYCVRMDSELTDDTRTTVRTRFLHFSYQESTQYWSHIPMFYPSREKAMSALRSWLP